ncbi:protein of unknown function (plasmid) [Streptantibioticus cattleyicolor NRRL 8057 = DSM 46488]|nr:protein of unknown function [Streptantibioticus cattleyicolor NRRL 8057 = DSM 46488]
MRLGGAWSRVAGQQVSSPRARGCSFAPGPQTAGFGIVPASAGVFLSAAERRWSSAYRPRERGGVPVHGATDDYRQASSLRARGVPWTAGAIGVAALSSRERGGVPGVGFGKVYGGWVVPANTAHQPRKSAKAQPNPRHSNRPRTSRGRPAPPPGVPPRRRVPGARPRDGTKPLSEAQAATGRSHCPSVQPW